MAGHPRLRLIPDGPIIEIDGDALYLGRDCHLAAHIPALTDMAVTNRHLRITRGNDGRWILEDLGGSSGTWQNGQRVSERTPLASGAEFFLGREGPGFLFLLPPDDLDGTPPVPRTRISNQDGSPARPFTVGQTPMARLKHERTGEEFSAQGYTIVIGRKPTAAQIVIRADDERHVSGRHAEIRFQANGRAVLCDLGSTNGTWVNNRVVSGQAPLRVGDLIRLGLDVTTLRVMALQT
jgi:pSer/pThr/pTyr-binding forkhead associated (FHA) protein